MRILLFSGKGGVGKTSLAAATGLELSRLGYRTLVMSVDPAHSLADAFDFETNLFHEKTGDPCAINGKLAIHEVNIQKEIKRHWREISSYVISVLRTTGINDVEAEELAILPGMEELSALMYVNQFRREDRYDVIVLDCAPTAESMRFVSMPTTLEWYMKHIFPFQRGLLKAVRPLANRVSPVELPTDNYFANIKDLFGRLDGIGELLEDPKITSVRLVTNPERMVLRETQRAFVYFSLHGLAVDGVIVNRVLPAEVTDQYFQEWRVSQARILEEIDGYFAPVQETQAQIDCVESLLKILQTYSRPDVARPELLDMRQEVQATLNFVRPLLEHRDMLVVARMPEQSLCILMDRDRFRQVLLNLLNNACDAMQAGGTIEITLRADQQWATLVVSDQGAGIPAAQLERIFEPFYSTKNTGTGLGLAIVRRHIEDAGGDVRCASRPGRGSDFTIRFPLQLTKAAPTPLPQQSTSE